MYTYVKEESDLFFIKNGQKISPWHDIPLFAKDDSDTVNMVVEIPRQSKAKMEASKAPPSIPLGAPGNWLAKSIANPLQFRYPKRRVTIRSSRTSSTGNQENLRIFLRSMVILAIMALSLK